MRRPLCGLDSRKTFVGNTHGAEGGVHPESCVPIRKRVVGAIGGVDCILRIADQGRICATNVARWDTSFGIVRRPRGRALVHLGGNDGRTRDKHNY